MLVTFTQHLNLSTTELETLLSFNFQDMLNSSQIQQLLDGLNVNLLRQTAPTAKVTLTEKLPAFYDWLQNELGVKRVPSSPDHSITWIVNFLNRKESLMRLVEMHRPVSLPVLEQATPRLVGLFDAVEDVAVRQEWQKAIALLCLILAVAAQASNSNVPLAIASNTPALSTVI